MTLRINHSCFLFNATCAKANNTNTIIAIECLQTKRMNTFSTNTTVLKSKKEINHLKTREVELKKKNILRV